MNSVFDCLYPVLFSLHILPMLSIVTCSFRIPVNSFQNKIKSDLYSDAWPWQWIESIMVFFRTRNLYGTNCQQSSGSNCIYMIYLKQFFGNATTQSRHTHTHTHISVVQDFRIMFVIALAWNNDVNPVSVCLPCVHASDVKSRKIWFDLQHVSSRLQCNA